MQSMATGKIVQTYQISPTDLAQSLATRYIQNIRRSLILALMPTLLSTLSGLNCALWVWLMP